MPALVDRLGQEKLRFIAAGVVSAAAFVLYVLTLAPTVTLVDSGELIVASAKLGVAHPPGFPLYVLLAHIASLLPLGSTAVRIHLASTDSINRMSRAASGALAYVVSSSRCPTASATESLWKPISSGGAATSAAECSRTSTDLACVATCVGTGPPAAANS